MNETQMQRGLDFIQPKEPWQSAFWGVTMYVLLRGQKKREELYMHTTPQRGQQGEIGCHQAIKSDVNLTNEPSEYCPFTLASTQADAQARRKIFMLRSVFCANLSSLRRNQRTKNKERDEARYLVYPPCSYACLCRHNMGALKPTPISCPRNLTHQKQKCIVTTVAISPASDRLRILLSSSFFLLFFSPPFAFL